MIKSLPTFFFPTKIIFVDDDTAFIQQLNRTVENHTATSQTFSNPSQALSYINEQYNHGAYYDRWLGSHYHKLKRHDYAHYYQMYQVERFQQISTIVSDYSMPGMNGLEFLAKINDPYVRKIMLTGEADESIAINAFNEGLIHGFIRKGDPKVSEILVTMIQQNQTEFFRNLTLGIVETAKEDASDTDTLLQFPGFVDIFADVIKQCGIVEYYLLDSVGKFLLIDAQGNLSGLYAYSRDEQKIFDSFLEADAYFFNSKEFIFPDVPAATPKFLKDRESVDRVDGQLEEPRHDFAVYSIENRPRFVWGYIPKLINTKSITCFNDYKKSLLQI